MSDGTIETPALWGAEGFEALYNLKDDPGESVNLLGTNEHRLGEMREALATYRRHCEQFGLDARAAAGVHDAVDPDSIEDLESLGYL